jgi:hypothetical protein
MSWFAKKVKASPIFIFCTDRNAITLYWLLGSSLPRRNSYAFVYCVVILAASLTEFSELDLFGVSSSIVAPAKLDSKRVTARRAPGSLKLEHSFWQLKEQADADNS